ncbi:MAG: transporter substrate-binding domain-containing protein [Microcystaceae cyanobacterium]
MLIRHFLMLWVFINHFIVPSNLQAQDLIPTSPPQTLSDSQSENEFSSPLKVGFAGEQPAVILSDTGELSGVSIEVWKALATQLDLDYEIVAYSSVTEALISLERGTIDVALGSVTVTPERLERFDFTQPIIQEELTLLLPSAPPTLWSFIRPFLGWAFLSSAGLICVCLFLIGNLLWLAEHKKNPQQFSPQYLKGVREGMWCATATFTTVGYGDRYPITNLGRTIAGCWSIISIVIISSFTAGIATTLTLAFSPRSVMEFNRPQDLKNARLAVIKGSNAIRWANHYQARVSPVKNLSTAFMKFSKVIVSVKLKVMG